MAGCQNYQLAQLAGSGCNKFYAFSLVLVAILHMHGCNFVAESKGGGEICESKAGWQKERVFAILLQDVSLNKKFVKRGQFRIIKLW